ncbi:hypothetical protein HAY47_004578 [Salmonella enterica]|nr:hypothetical protein [Salmonella enterica subsp. salamae]EEP0951935.1 hypothetical protein [Salmonella enterica]EEP0974875.1 hypothetical protein [Salmonella enterica]EEP1007136.1 hypothetical protein [Salmonella enterica]EEP1011795.1 hypothetical protein [Salmonella enterica]
MNKISRIEKKEITRDWGNLLKDYTLYKSSCFIKRNGPILTGIYLRPSDAGYRYTPQFHLHSLLKPSSFITLSPVFSLCNKKNVADAISYRRHCNEFEQIALEFKTQFSEAFIKRADCKIIDEIYNRSKYQYVGYPYNEMTEHVILLYWCGYESLVEEKIKEYKNRIQQWPEAVILNINGESGWESNVRELMDINKMNNTINEELNKLKLTKLQDYGLIYE